MTIHSLGILVFASVLVSVAVAPASLLSHDEANATHRCAYGGSNYALSSQALFAACRQAASIYAAHVRTADGPQQYDEYLKAQAVMQIYAAGAAEELGQRDVGTRYLRSARMILSNLTARGHTEDIRSQSRRTMRCFFEKDMEACHALFPQ